jgi:hypothetical protein
MKVVNWDVLNPGAARSGTREPSSISAASNPLKYIDPTGLDVIFGSPDLQTSWNQAKAADPILAFEMGRLESDHNVNVLVQADPYGAEIQNAGGGFADPLGKQWVDGARHFTGTIHVNSTANANTYCKAGLKPSMPALLAHEAGHYVADIYYGLDYSSGVLVPSLFRQNYAMAIDMENLAQSGLGLPIRTQANLPHY